VALLEEDKNATAKDRVHGSVDYVYSSLDQGCAALLHRHLRGTLGLPPVPIKGGGAPLEKGTDHLHLQTTKSPVHEEEDEARS